MIGFALFAVVTVIPSGESFDCTPVRVWDGDGPIWCEEGPRVRLAGIAAREIDGTCSDKHPCPVIGGEEARDMLVRLIGKPTGKSSEGHILVTGPTMRCRSDGNAGGIRTAGWCQSPKSGDVNCAAVEAGFALRWAKYWRSHTCE